MGANQIFCFLAVALALGGTPTLALPPASTVLTGRPAQPKLTESNCAEVLSPNLNDLEGVGAAVAAWVRSIYRETSQPFLSIVIPAYREETRLPHSIRLIKNFLDHNDIPIEVLIIVEKSPDHTLTVAQNEVGYDPRIQVVDNVVQKGKGYAVRSGMLRAQGEIGPRP